MKQQHTSTFNHLLLQFQFRNSIPHIFPHTCMTNTLNSNDSHWLTDQAKIFLNIKNKQTKNKKTHKTEKTPEAKRIGDLKFFKWNLRGRHNKKPLIFINSIDVSQKQVASYKRFSDFPLNFYNKTTYSTGLSFCLLLKLNLADSFLALVLDHLKSKYSN